MSEFTLLIGDKPIIECELSEGLETSKMSSDFTEKTFTIQTGQKLDPCILYFTQKRGDRYYFKNDEMKLSFYCSDNLPLKRGDKITFNFK